MTDNRFERIVERAFYAAITLILCGFAALVLAGCVVVWREVLR